MYLVCRICGKTDTFMWRCLPMFSTTHPVPFALCAKCMQVGLAEAHKSVLRNVLGKEEKKLETIEEVEETLDKIANEIKTDVHTSTNG